MRNMRKNKNVQLSENKKVVKNVKKHVNKNIELNENIQLNENASIKEHENMRRNKHTRKKQKVIQINVGFMILKIIAIIIIISVITAQTVRTIIQARTSTNENTNSASEISDEDTTAEKTEGQTGLYQTGISYYTAINNVFDLAGDVCDWTLSSGGTTIRAIRGDDAHDTELDYWAATRNIQEAKHTQEWIGCRAVLLLK